MTTTRHGRLYRRLLAVYPPTYRARFAAPMTASFEQDIDEAQSRGRWAVLALWIRSTVDVVRLGLGERWRAGRRSNGTSRGRRMASSFDVRRDVRFALRQFSKEPGLALAIVVTLALGIGLTTTAFTIAYGAVWRGLPFGHAEELVHFSRGNVGEGFDLAVSHHDYLDWREQQTTFEDLGAFVEAIVHITDGSSPAERQYGVFISPVSFSLLRVAPHVGRLLTDADTQSGASPVVLLSYDLWRRRYGADSGLVGQHVQMNGVATQVVGVMPPRFGFPIDEHVWLPLKVDRSGVRGSGRLDVFGRLRPGVSLTDARQEFAIMSQRLADAYVENQGVEARLASFQEEYLGDDFVRSMHTLFVGALLILFVACANVTNLLLARTTRRSRELAVRTALGASRARVLSQLIVEITTLAVAGAVLGAGLAGAGVHWFSTAWIVNGGADLPHGSSGMFWWDFSIGLVPALCVVIVTVAAALLAGIVPAIRGASTDVAAAIKDEGRGSSSFRAGRLTKGLVIAEVALSTALLTAGGLTFKSMLNTTAVGLGLSTDNVITARMSLPNRRLGMSDANYADAESQRVFWTALTERLISDTRLGAAAVTTAIPVTGAGGIQLGAEGAEGAGGPGGAGPADRIRKAVVSDGFFATFDVTPIAGRTFGDQDRAGTEPVVVVNESLARARFPNQSALFKRIRIHDEEGNEPWLTIVGVVPDLWMDGSRNRDREGLYLPLSQVLDGSPNARLGPWSLTFMSVVARGQIDGAPLTQVVQHAVAAVDPTIPVYGVRSMNELVASAVGRFRVYGIFYIVLGSLAFLLTLLGMYSVISFVVAGRTTELGIRMALGAASGRLIRSVVREGVTYVVVGLVMGVGFAVWLTQGLRQVLYGVEPNDPLILGVIAVMFLATGMVAAYVPARRAARVDPATVLGGRR